MKVEKDITQILEYAFSCKLYTNLLLDISHNSKMWPSSDSEIFMSVELLEFMRYIENAKKVFAQNNINFETDYFKPYFDEIMFSTHQSWDSVELINYKYGDTNINRTNISSAFWYEDKIKNFKLIDVSNLDEVTKEAFFGFDALKSLKMYTCDILSQEEREKVKHFIK